MNPIEFAQKFAAIQHFGISYGTKPYTYHLEQVAMVLQRFKFLEKDNEELHIAATLHDVIEDTNISYEQVKFAFGEKVADAVYSVTNEMGRSRLERFKKTYPKIAENEMGLIVKLADRIANIEFSHGIDSRHAIKYREEWPAFKENLFNKDEEDNRIKKMWEYLSTLMD
jgi:guanosine-3',5'-bis(diphosphate) 3'-pyrophosphohydrolase